MANNLLYRLQREKDTDPSTNHKQGLCGESGRLSLLGVSIQESLSWSVNTSELLKKAKQRLYFLRILIIRITSHRDCW